MASQQESLLLRIPAELQLAIFEYAVQEDDVLLINCGCDSSYQGDRQAWKDDQNAWLAGEKNPPSQPALTRTCTYIRAVALPLYYRQNTFRGHYCHAANLDVAVDWLERIGHQNRLYLRDFCFWDLNQDYDDWRPQHVKKINKSAVGKDMGGVLETLKAEDRCLHKVCFDPFNPEWNEVYEGLEHLFQ